MYLINENVPKKKEIRQGKKQLDRDLMVAGKAEPTLFTEAKEIGGIEGKCNLGFFPRLFQDEMERKGTIE